MNPKRSNIALVEYYNTEPFLHGLKAQGEFELLRAYPAQCATFFNNHYVDIALVPLAAYFEMDGAKIISNYGIACNGKVRTVVLFSNDEIKNLHTIYLDNHSKTSIQLLKVLLREYWQIDVKLIVKDVVDVILEEGEGALMIGDKVFKNEGRFANVYDLGEEWKKHTGLPFVFAVWVGRDSISKNEIKSINECLQWGVAQIEKMIPEWSTKYAFDLQGYFNENIDYHITSAHWDAMDLFRNKLSNAAMGVVK